MLLFLSENIILFNNQTITCLLIQIKILYTCIQNILYRISKFYVFLCITLYYICIKSQKVKRKNSIFDRSGSQCLVIHMQICKYILQFYKLRVDLICQIEMQKEKNKLSAQSCVWLFRNLFKYSNRLVNKQLLWQIAQHHQLFSLRTSTNWSADVAA